MSRDSSSSPSSFGPLDDSVNLPSSPSSQVKVLSSSQGTGSFDGPPLEGTDSGDTYSTESSLSDDYDYTIRTDSSSPPTVDQPNIVADSEDSLDQSIRASVPGATIALSSLSSPSTIELLDVVLACGHPWIFDPIDKPQFTANCKFGKNLLRASMAKLMESESD